MLDLVKLYDRAHTPGELGAAGPEGTCLMCGWVEYIDPVPLGPQSFIYIYMYIYFDCVSLDLVDTGLV